MSSKISPHKKPNKPKAEMGSQARTAPTLKGSDSGESVLPDSNQGEGSC